MPMQSSVKTAGQIILIEPSESGREMLAERLDDEPPGTANPEEVRNSGNLGDPGPALPVTS